MIKRVDGWQTWVDIYEDHVIKTPKSRREINKKVESWLKVEGKLDQLKWRVDSLHNNIAKSVRLIKRSKVPLKLLGNPDFLEGGRVKQELAEPLEKIINKYINAKDMQNVKSIIDKFIRLTLILWDYGIHEKTFKFDVNFGLIEGEVVLIDLFELTGNKETVKKQIKKRMCDRPWGLNKKYPEFVSNYYVEQSKKYFTLENLEKHWKSKE